MEKKVLREPEQLNYNQDYAPLAGRQWNDGRAIVERR